MMVDTNNLSAPIRHPDEHHNDRPALLSKEVVIPQGQTGYMVNLDFQCRVVEVDTYSSWCEFADWQHPIPPNIVGHMWIPVRRQSVFMINTVQPSYAPTIADSASGFVRLRFYEADRGAGSQVSVSGSAGSNVTIAGPLGQASMAASVPVVIASNQSAVPVTATISGTPNVAITGPLGQAAMAASVPVVIASNQSAVPVSGTFWQATQPVSIAATVTIAGTVTANAGTNLNTSLLALESGGNLATIAGRTPALGQALMAASSPVVIASNQSAIPTTLSGNTNQVEINNGGNIAGVDTAGHLQTNSLSSANYVNGQQTSTGTAATLLSARQTRIKATIRNQDAANSVWVGATTVTTANGVLIKAGESRDFFGAPILQIIDNGAAHAVVDYIDYYD